MSVPEDICPSCGREVLDIDVRCGSCNAALTSTGAQRMIGSVVLEHYEVTDILGQGGMSVVYRGKHKITGQEVALKVLPPELAAYRDVKGRFLEEGRALAQLDHPNIVHLYNFGDDGDCLVLAMQFVRGVTWERMIMEDACLPWRRSAELTRDVSNALDYAHGRGIIHRDMKPSNVLVRELDGAATVMDFGIAKMQSSTKLTATGQTMGTVRYMSPEQVRGMSVGVETDIYSLAMTTYESLVGDTPFTGDTHFEIMTKHLNEVPVPPSKRGIDIPPPFEAILMRAISKAPSDRQPTAKLFKEQLQAILDGQQPENIVESAKTKPLKPKKLRAESHAASTEAEPIGEITELPVGKRKPGTGVIAGVGLVVLVAGAATVALSRDSGSSQDNQTGAPEIVAKKPPDDRALLAEGFVLPGLTPHHDETNVLERLRVVASGEMSAEAIGLQVSEARDHYRAMAKERGWPELPIPMLLTVVVGSPSMFCNPLLYTVVKAGQKVPPNCHESVGWYIPTKQTLYLPEAAKGEGLRNLPYWITAVRCLHDSPAESCEAVESGSDSFMRSSN